MKIDKHTYHQHVRKHEPGSVIFREGDPGSDMYVIISGQVEIRKSTSGTSSKVLATLGKGDLFGEMALIDKQPRSATAVATSATVLLALNGTLYESMLGSSPDFARKMNRLLSERIRRSNQIIQSLITTNRQRQVWNGLVEFAQAHGTPTFKGIRVSVEEFARWASERLGIPEKEVAASLASLIKKEVVKYSARGKEEILVEPKAGVALEG